MDNQPDSDAPSDETQGQPPFQSPSNSASANNKTSNNTEKQTDIYKDTTREFTREFKWFEIASLIVNTCLAVTGIFVLCIYTGQLKVMQGQLDQMTGGSKQTDRLICETHTLADNAGKQAANASDQVKKLGDLVAATNKQVVAVNGQMSIMQQQLEASDRPWISVDASASSPLTYDSSGIRVTFAFVPKNIGRSPAQNIWIEPALTIGSMGDDYRSAQKHICDKIATRGRVVGFPGYILFPGDHYTQEESLGMSDADIDSHWSKFELSRGPIDVVPLILVGCVDYTFEASPRHHQTSFAFDVRMRDGRLVLKSKTPLAPESLILMRLLFGGYSAN
jgi:hypothetical protein